MVEREQNPSVSTEDSTPDEDASSQDYDDSECELENVLLIPASAIPKYDDDDSSECSSDFEAKLAAEAKWLLVSPTSANRAVACLNNAARSMSERERLSTRRVAQGWLQNYEQATTPQTGIRGWAASIVNWEHFETLVLVLIGINCIMLALYDPLDVDQSSDLSKTTQIVEKVMVCFFVLEIVVKMLAHGLWRGRRAFFRSGWNWMDLLCVVVGLPSLVLASGFSDKFTIIRALRVLRPLRTITRVPGLVVLVNTLIQCFSGMVPVLVIFTGFFFLFGVGGCQLFMGHLNSDCYNVETLLLNETYGRKCGYVECPEGNACYVSQQAPNEGITSFNNIFVAFLTIFVAMTLEGWVDVMYMLQDSQGIFAASCFFLLLVLVGSFFVLQLTMAIVSNQYELLSNESEQLIAERGEEKREYNSDEELEEEHRATAKWSRAWLRKLLKGDYAERMILLMILANMICLCIEHARECVKDGKNQACEMSGDVKDVLLICNIIFTIVFTVEAAVKIFAHGTSYFKHRWNNVDFSIVILSYIEIFLLGESSVTAMRILRLFRVFKMNKTWPAMHQLGSSIWKSSSSMGFLTLLAALFLFMTAVLGLQLFGGKFRAPYLDVASVPRSNFDTFPEAALSIFQIISGENWNELLYDGMQSTSWWAMIYFLLVFMGAQFIIMNLYIAILLRDYETGEPPSTEFLVGMLTCGLYTFCPDRVQEQLFAEEEEPKPTPAPFEEKLEFSDQPMQRAEFSLRSVVLLEQEVQRRAQQEKLQKLGTKSRCAWVKLDKIFDKSDQADWPLQGHSLKIFSPTNSLRVWLAELVEHPAFEGAVLLVILVSSVLLVVEFETNFDKEDAVGMALRVTDVTITIIFIIELIIRVIVQGFFFGDKCFWQSGWNRIDFVSTTMSILSLIFGESFKAARAMRCVRALRSVRRVAGLRVVIDTLLLCAPSFVNILFLALMVLSIFGILGVQIWAGKMWRCVDPENETLFGVNVHGCDTPNVWKNAEQNFDNFGAALLTLFNVASLELWLDVMYATMDTPNEMGDAPERNSKWYFSLYFVIFICIGSFLILNLFISAVVDTFETERDKATGMVMLTDSQEMFVLSMRQIMKTTSQTVGFTPPAGDGCWFHFRMQCFSIVSWGDSSGPGSSGSGSSFDHLVACLVYLNVVSMCMYYWSPPSPDDFPVAAPYTSHKEYNNVIDKVQWVFLIMFVVEALLRIVALGWIQYWNSHWNKFDFGVATLSLVAVLSELSGSLNVVSAVLSPAFLRVIRALRIFPLGKAIRRFPAARRLLETLLYSLPGFINVAGVLLLVLYIYAILGMAWFGEDEYKAVPGNYYTVHANFGNFGSAMMLLFRMTTGESWNGVMVQVMEEHPAAWIYFVSFQFLGAYLIMNLLSAIVLSNFTEMCKQENWDISPDQVQHYADVWGQFDPLCTNMIAVQYLPKLLRELEPPLGFAHTDQKDSEPTDGDPVDLFIKRQLPLAEDANVGSKVHFIETFMALVKYQYGKEEIREMNVEQIYSVATDALLEFPSLISMGQKLTLQEVTNLIKIQIWWRKVVTKRRENGTLKSAVRRTSAPGLMSKQDDLVQGWFKEERTKRRQSMRMSRTDITSRSRADSRSSADSSEEDLSSCEQPNSSNRSTQRSSREQPPSVDYSSADHSLTPPNSRHEPNSRNTSPVKPHARLEIDTTKHSKDDTAPECAEASTVIPNTRSRSFHSHSTRKKHGPGDSLIGEVRGQPLDAAALEKQAAIAIRENATRLFHRYDLDESGTVNSQQELQQITINLAFTTGLQVKYQAMQDAIDAAMIDKLQEEWDLEKYIAWFVVNVQPLAEPAKSPPTKQKKKSSSF